MFMMKRERTEHLNLEAEEEMEQQRDVEADRRRRGAGGRTNHAAPVEANAYRIVGTDEYIRMCLFTLIYSLDLKCWCIFIFVGRSGATADGLEEAWKSRSGIQRPHGCAERTTC